MAMRAVFSPSSPFSFNRTATAATAAYSAHFPNFPFALSGGRSISLLFNIPTAASPILRRRGRRGRLSPGVAYSAASVSGKSIHDFTVKDIDGMDISLSKFKGKVLLVVNVASRCGLTSSNYSELSHLYEKYKSQGFEILAFPCNQFGGQEPGTNPQIKEFACTRFKAEFPIFDKVDVNGPSTAPVYQFLKSSTGGFLGDLIKWNFEKFLVNGDGNVIERYSPTTSPFQIEKDIKKLLAA